MREIKLVTPALVMDLQQTTGNITATGTDSITNPDSPDTWGTDSLVGKCANFTSLKNLRISNRSASWSMWGWFKPTNSGGNYPRLLSPISEVANTIQVYGYGATTMGLSMGIIDNNSAYFEAYANSNYAYDRWCFIGVSIDAPNKTAVISINGKCTTTVIACGDINAATVNTMLFARATDNTSNWFIGSVAWVKTANVGLTAKQFAVLYQSTRGGFLL